MKNKNMLYMTTEEVRKAAKKNFIIILPVGVIEEHGPHLPLGTDTFQILHCVEKALERADALMAPVFHYGLCSSTKNFAGTITISFKLLENLTREVLKEINRNGFKKVIILSGHAGGDHMTAIRLACKKVVKESGMRIFVASIAELVLKKFDEELIRKIPKEDKHAGFVETSTMLYIDENFVKKDKMPGKSVPAYPEYEIIINPEKYFPSGVMGNPKGANKEIGEKIIRLAVESIIELVKNVRCCDYNLDYTE